MYRLAYTLVLSLALSSPVFGQAAQENPPDLKPFPCNAARAMIESIRSKEDIVIYLEFSGISKQDAEAEVEDLDNSEIDEINEIKQKFRDELVDAQGCRQ